MFMLAFLFAMIYVIALCLAAIVGIVFWSIILFLRLFVWVLPPYHRGTKLFPLA